MMNEAELKPRRPYLLRAFYDWLLDNDFTPHLVVDATLPYVDVPFEYVQDGQIVLNVAPQSVVELDLGNEFVRFTARFGGNPMAIAVPIYAVVAIYSRENGSGTMFDSEPVYEAQLEKIERELEEEEANATMPSEPLIMDEPEDETQRPKGPPTLTVVK